MKAEHAPTKLRQLSNFTISRRPQKWTRRKSCIIWARHQHITAPVAYISKPKHIPQQVFDEFMDSIQLHMAMFQEEDNQNQ